MKRSNAPQMILLMTLFSAAAAVFLFTIGIDAIAERHPFQFFADSNTYHATYSGDIDFDRGLVGIDSNYLGPIALLTLVGANHYLVMLINVAMFTTSMLHICRLLNVDPLKVVCLLLLSPLTVSSLLSVNKEVFLFPFLAFALHAHVRRSIAAVALALLFAVLVRWQLVIFYLLLLAICGPVRPLRSRVAVAVLLLAALSVIYWLIQPLIEPILAYVENSIEIYEGGGSGLFEWVLAQQNKGLYFLVFPIKALHLLFGMGLKLDRLFSPVEVYNDLFVGGHCAVALVTFLLLLKRRLLTLESDLMAAALIFLAVFCVTPIFAPRYLYLTYVIAVLVLAGAPRTLRRPRALRRHALSTDRRAAPTNTSTVHAGPQGEPT